MSDQRILRLCDTISSERSPRKLLRLMKQLRHALTDEQNKLNSAEQNASLEHMANLVTLSVCIESLLQSLESQFCDGQQSAASAPRRIM